MVRIGILGSGGMADYQAKKLSAVGGCELAACKDHKAGHAEAFARRWGIPAWYSSLDSLLEDGACDALTCVVVDARHRALAEKVLERGLPLFCEKPLARTLADCAGLVELAHGSGAPTLVNFSKRNAPALGALKAALAAGAAGKLLSVEASYLQGWTATLCWGDWLEVPRWRWRLVPELGTAGVVGDLGAHLADALLYLFGPIEAVPSAAAIVNLEGAMEKGLVRSRELPEEFRCPGQSSPVAFSAAGRLGAAQGGAPVLMRASWIDAASVDEFRIRIRGERGDLDLDLGRSRDAVRFEPAGASPSKDLRGPAEPSTYESFVRLAADHLEGIPPRNAGLPDLAHAFEVQRLLDRLLPGVLPA